MAVYHEPHNSLLKPHCTESLSCISTVASWQSCSPAFDWSLYSSVRAVFSSCQWMLGSVYCQKAKGSTMYLARKRGRAKAEEGTPAVSCCPLFTYTDHSTRGETGCWSLWMECPNSSFVNHDSRLKSPANILTSSSQSPVSVFSLICSTAHSNTSLLSPHIEKHSSTPGNRLGVKSVEFPSNTTHTIRPCADERQSGPLCPYVWTGPQMESCRLLSCFVGTLPTRHQQCLPLCHAVSWKSIHAVPSWREWSCRLILSKQPMSHQKRYFWYHSLSEIETLRGCELRWF